MISPAPKKRVGLHKNNIQNTAPLRFILARPLTRVAVMFIAGCAIGANLRFTYLYALAPTALTILIILIKKPAVRRVLAPLLAITAAVAYSCARLTPPSMLPQEGTYPIRATVASAASVRQDGAARFEVSGISLLMDGEWTPTTRGTAYVKAKSESSFKLLPGDMIELTGFILRPHPSVNPGGFNAVLWAKANTYMFTILSDSIVAVSGSRPVFMRMFASAGRALSGRIDALFAGGAPLIRAMLLGDRVNMPGWMNDDFARSGIIHLLSVSGLHVGFIYLMLNRLISWFHLSPRVRFGLLAVLLAAYACLAQLTPPVVRASIMLLYTAYAMVARRKPDPYTSLALSAALILLFRPGDILQAGFLLSFGCMLGITMLYGPLSKATRNIKLPAPIQNKISKSVCLSISAQVGALAPCAVTFGYISIAGVLTNLIAIPLAAMLFYVSVPILALDAFARPLAAILAYVPRLMIRALSFAARIGAAAGPILRVPKRLPAIMIIAIYTAICLFSDITALKIIWKAAISAALLAIGIIATVTPLSQARFVQLSVGQALAGTLHANGGAVVYDTGNDGRELIDYLLYTGDDIDDLIISHGHMDHCGGLNALLDSIIKVKRIHVTSGVGGDVDAAYGEALIKARGMGIPVNTLSRGDTLQTKCGEFQIIWPPENHRSSNANDTSVVALVTVNAHTMLFTGDIDNSAPTTGIDCDILYVAHHGSGSSTSDKFLLAASPDVAIISCGGTNAALPHPATLERLDDLDIPYLRTNQTGAITILLNRGDIKITCWKQ